MLLAYKQLAKQLNRNKVFIALLLLLAALTTLSFFFVVFSIDGNMAALNDLAILTENQHLFKKALESNTFLAYALFAIVTALTAFVFVMFFYRFFRANKRQMGCLKALGFKDNALRLFFVVFAAVISLAGAVIGLIGGYFLSDVLLDAYKASYQLLGLVKGTNLFNLIVGFGQPVFVFCLIAFLCYSFVRGKEPGMLIAGTSHHARFSLLLKAANGISRVIPVKNKFPYRIALRKPLAVLLVIIAVMSFNVCMILGQSLNVSSQKVYNSQTIGHNYEYDTRYAEYRTTPLPDGVMPYLVSPAELITGRYHIEEQIIVGLYNTNEVYELKSMSGEILPVPEMGTVYINPGLSDTYGVNIRDILTVYVGGTEYRFAVAGIAFNAKSAAVYINAGELSEILGVPTGTYNGVLSMEQMPGGETTTKAERLERLNRDAVSNNTSAVINQLIGGIVGVILIFLALYINFQDNTRDMLILHMMGYKAKSIRKLLIDVYMPIVWAAFLLTLTPSILIASSIQKSFSIATNDYMPFGTSVIVIAAVFLMLNVIHWLVQSMFGHGIRRTIAKEDMAEFVYAE